mgnify:CR=1 FL=1|jgi:TRAP-type C4-dicarboxylate transport system permease small subunit
MEILRLLADKLIGLSALIGSVGLLIEVCIILVDVIGRALGNPLFGSQDMITMTMVIVVFGGMAICDRGGGHISIDIFKSHFSASMNHMIDIVAAVLGAVVFMMIVWTVYESLLLSRMLNLSTNLLNLPKAWFQWVLCCFALLTSFAMFLRAIELIFYKRDVCEDEKI